VLEKTHVPLVQEVHLTKPDEDPFTDSAIPLPPKDDPDATTTIAMMKSSDFTFEVPYRVGS
jgi:hypothetical protein